MSLKQILLAKRESMAFVFGNGINRFRTKGDTNSWWSLLNKIAQNHLRFSQTEVPRGLSLTEFYDLIELGRAAKSASGLQKEFGSLISDWMPQEQHEWVTGWASAWNQPILTTNFDFNFNNALDAQLYHVGKGGFTDFYPWESYFGFRTIDDPTAEFGIWHINGRCLYSRSLRLGLTHYMGAVQRARSWIHKGDDDRLFSGKDVGEWRGSRSWLHIMFNCDLLFAGLGLNQNEVFLRWLLIERAKYFRAFPERARSAWYVETKASHDPGKSFFLNGVGVETILVDTHNDIWGEKIWT